MTKKICVVTSGRADYGLLKLVMRQIQKDRQFQLQVIATGSHFLSRFGSTYREIIKDGFKINARVDMRPTGDSAVALGQAMSIGVKGISRALVKLQPDLIVLLGDRYEILATAAAATLVGVPIAHLHGGELTEGAYDDAFRHAITKLSHLHFPSTSVYRKRIIQMGEEPKRVFQVGALGVENVFVQKFFKRGEIEKLLGFKFISKNLLITFHPTTMESGQAGPQIKMLLKALATLRDTVLIFTIPGADKENKIILSSIKKFAKKKPKAYVYRSLGSRLYLSLMKEVDAVIGNSSSGLLEAPALQKPVVNIGNRQKGRICSTNIINCKANTKEIKKSIKIALTKKFKKTSEKTKHVFGKGKTSAKIVQILKQQNLKHVRKKTFFNISK